MVTFWGEGGDVDGHTLHGGRFGHIDHSVCAAVSEATVPGFYVGGTCGMEGGVLQCGARVVDKRREMRDDVEVA